MKRHLRTIVMLTLAIVLGGTKSATAAAADDAKPSVTVFPVVATPHRFPDEFAKRVGLVIATFLEKSGLEDLEVADKMFSPPDSEEIAKIAEAFGKHVSENPIKTDFAVFTQFLGTPQTGVKGIRTIVVDKSGKVLLAESAGKAQFDGAPLRPRDLMSCCAFVGRRLQQFWQLEDPFRPNAPEGKLAQFWKKDAGAPTPDELTAITKRAETLKRNIKTASCTVYPVLVGEQSDKQCAIELAAMLSESGLGKAQTLETDPGLKIAAHSNEQKVLWDTARAFRDFVKKNRPTTDYAIYADFGLFDTKVRYVHAIICDQSGDWVLIDMQNSHHPSFERISPKSAADCNRLLLARLKQRLSE